MNGDTRSKLTFLPVAIIGMILSGVPEGAEAAPCIRVDAIAKWEILDHNQTVVYDASGNSIAFIEFPSAYNGGVNLRSGKPTFRFFSPTICNLDRVQINGNVMTTVFSIELVRKQ